MSSRPKRKSAQEAVEKIREVLSWESCSETSEAFQAAAERMEMEFNAAKRRRLEKKLATPTSTDDEDSDSADNDSNNYEEMSTISSDDVYSDTGVSSSEEDDEELCDSNSENDNSPDIVLEVLPLSSAPVECVSP